MGSARNITLLGVISLCAMSSSVTAEAISCGGAYTIEEGDTLSSIARRAYDNVAAQELLFNANRAVLKNIDVIFTGTELKVPCISDNAILPTQDAEVVPESQSIRWASADVAFLTGSDYAPFTDQRYEKGGMITAIARRAMEIGYPSADVSVSWVNDWGAHLQTLLLERRAFDAGFPWYRPACENRANLDANAILRCDNFHFSNPVYESILPFFSKFDAELSIEQPQDMEGMTVCRPSGFLTFDLVEKGLLAADHFDGGSSSVTLVQPNTPEDCFEMVLSGEADIASFNSLVAQSTLNRMGVADKFAAHDKVASILAHHIVVPKNRPEAAALMRRINDGLDVMQKEGELGELKSKYIQIFFAEN